MKTAREHFEAQTQNLLDEFASVYPDMRDFPERMARLADDYVRNVAEENGKLS